MTGDQHHVNVRYGDDNDDGSGEKIICLKTVVVVSGTCIFLDLETK